MEQAPEAILNVLIIGAGQIGAFYDTPQDVAILTHAHAFTADPRFRLVGFYDAQPSRSQQAQARWGGQAFSSVAAAFQNQAIDIACITAPDEVHAELLQKLATYPVQLVFCEKPLATDLNQADRILSLYQQQSIALAVNYTRRYVPQLQTLRRNIQTGRYGDFIGGCGMYGKGLLHNGSHLLDLVQFFVGTLSPVADHKSIGETIYDYTESDPSVSALLESTRQKQFYLKAIDSRLYTLMEIDLMFERGRIRLSECCRQLEIFDIAPDPLFAGYQGLRPTSCEMTDYTRALAFAADNLYQALRHGAPLLCSGRDALQTLKLCKSLI